MSIDTNDCWLWARATIEGYGAVGIKDRKTGRIGRQCRKCKDRKL